MASIKLGIRRYSKLGTQVFVVLPQCGDRGERIEAPGSPGGRCRDIGTLTVRQFDGELAQHRMRDYGRQVIEHAVGDPGHMKSIQ